MKRGRIQKMNSRELREKNVTELARDTKGDLGLKSLLIELIGQERKRTQAPDKESMDIINDKIDLIKDLIVEEVMNAYQNEQTIDFSEL